MAEDNEETTMTTLWHCDLNGTNSVTLSGYASVPARAAAAKPQGQPAYKGLMV